MERYLFWKKHKKKSRKCTKSKTCKDCDKRMITQRPDVVVSGHWELDFIVSSHSPTVLLVMVDRYTYLTIVEKLAHKTHQAVVDVVQKVKKRHGIVTITTDNDIVFNTWQSMEQKCPGVLFYFCDPYCSWQKGLVENTNRWIRVFVPKKKDLVEVREEELRAVRAYLNHTPRQCLNYATAYQTHAQQKKTQVS